MIPEWVHSLADSHLGDNAEVVGPDINGDYAARSAEHEPGLIIYHDGNTDYANFDVWPPNPGTYEDGTPFTHAPRPNGE